MKKVQGKYGDTFKNLAPGEEAMYRRENPEQMKFPKFSLPFGGKLSPNNRWVRMAKQIEWDMFEEKYALHFSDKMGAPAKPFRMALGALIIKERLGISDEETVAQIQENPYLQYFIGLEEFTVEAPFDASMMVHFRKRITPEMIAEINEHIIGHYDTDGDADGDNTGEGHGGGNESFENKGTLLVDATCAPADIKYPTDLNLLNESREKLEQIIDILHDGMLGKKPRTYRQKARREYLMAAKHKKLTEKMVRKSIKKQLQFVRRDIGHIQNMIQAGADLTKLSKKQYRDLLVIHEVYRQQKEMYDEKKHSIEDRIVSISQPHVRPIARGKAGAAVEFGAKISVSLVNGFSRVEHIAWNNYNESTLLVDHIEKFRERYGHYPATVEADKIYRTRENRAYCNIRGIKLSGPSLGRPRNGAAKEKENASERNPIEGKFGEGKRKYGLGRIMAKLECTSMSTIGIIILVMNLQKRLRLLLAHIFKWLFASNFRLCDAVL